MSETKTCTKCGVCKPVEMFRKDARAKQGRASNCKACHNVTCKKWLQANNEQSKAAIADWWKRNPEKAKEYSKRDYANHREKRLEARKRWAEKNPEKVKAASKRQSDKRPKRNRPFMYEACVETQREKANARAAAWYLQNRNRKKNYDIEYNRKAKEMLLDRYVKAAICQGTRIQSKTIPLPLIEAKRQQLKLQRLINERNSK